MAYTTETVKLLQKGTGLLSLATHYLPQVGTSDGSTLVFTHSLGGHKEQWEIVISQLFNICPNSIREVWVIEWQNHGHSADLNEKLLATRLATVGDYADIIRQFLESPHLTGKNVVAIGHSAGAAAWAIAISQTKLPIIPVIAIILFEPVFILSPIESNDERLFYWYRNVASMKARKATFVSLDEAAKWTRKYRPWKVWDERMLKCYMEHAFRKVSPESEQVTLRCTLEQEAEAGKPYTHILVGHLYPKLCATFPVHGIFGEVPDMHSTASRNQLFDGKDGRTMESVQIIPGAGHLAVQEKPDIAAEMIANVLKTIKALPLGTLRPRL